MSKNELIENIQKAPIRYAYTEMFLLKKNFFFHKETFFVSDYAKFVTTMLSFLLEKALEEIIPEQPTRFYNATANRDKVFRTINIEIFYKEMDELKVDSFKLIDINFMFKEINELYIKSIKKKYASIKENRKNIFVMFRFNKKEEPIGTIKPEEINYWNNFMTRNDYKYFHSFIKNRNIDVIKKYSQAELDKNIRLKAMSLNGEILFFKKLIEKELLIDCAKYVNENYIRRGFDVWSQDRKNISVLNMLKILDIKTLRIMEEDCLIYSLLNQREWVEFYITKSDIDWRTKQMEARENGFEKKLFLSKANELSKDRIDYLKNITMLSNENMVEIVDYLIANELQEDISKYLKVLCVSELDEYVSEAKKERFEILNNQINKLVSFQFKSKKNHLEFDFNIAPVLITNKLAVNIYEEKINNLFANLKSTLEYDLKNKKTILYFTKEISPFSYVLLEDVWERAFFNYGCLIIEKILKLDLEKTYELNNSFVSSKINITDLKGNVGVIVTDIQRALNNLECAQRFCLLIMEYVLDKRREAYDVFINEKIKSNTYSFFLKNVHKEALFYYHSNKVYKSYAGFYYEVLHKQMEPFIKEAILRNKLSKVETIIKTRKKI